MPVPTRWFADQMNIPNILTLIRLLLIPVFVVVYTLPVDWANEVAALVFWCAAITDWFDGYLARRLNQQSSLGAFIDPLADKLMVVTALILILSSHTDNPWLVYSVLIIIAREITISSLREWMAVQGKSQDVAVSFFGKAKTVGQMFAIWILIYQEDVFGLPTFMIGVGFLVWAAFLTLLSLGIYLMSAWNTLKNAG